MATDPFPLLTSTVSAPGLVTLTVLEDEPDLLLGIMPKVPRHDHRAALKPGETLLMYTDGLIEMHDGSFVAGQEALAGTASTLAAEQTRFDLDEFLDPSL